MKKKYYLTAACLLALAAGLLLGAKAFSGNTGKNHGAADTEAVSPGKTTVLRGNLSMDGASETPMKGWFIEHLKEKLGIEIVQADDPVFNGSFGGSETGLDVCYLESDEENFYTAVRQGKLRNLEEYLTEYPQLYERYQNSIDKMKAHTYKNTGKKGVFGIPVCLRSFDDIGEEGHCMAIPTGSSHPEQAMKLIAYSASDDGIMDIVFGPEGQMWKKENGKYVLLQKWWEHDAGDQFVETEQGREDYYTAVCKLRLVGNYDLGCEVANISPDEIWKDSASRKKIFLENTGKNRQDASDGAASSGKTTVLRGNLSIAWSPETPMEGWFIEHLKKNLGIEILQADYPVGYGIFDGCENGVDVCYLESAYNYYTAVKKGEIRDLENYLKEYPQIYERYHRSIDRMKYDTYRYTGKKGIFGIPVRLRSFDDMGKEGYCMVIPTGSSYPEQAMRLIAYSASEDGIMDIAFGPEGQMWKKKNGRYVLLQKYWEHDQGDKFIKTEQGREDCQTALCKLGLVGNYYLGCELANISPDEFWKDSSDGKKK